MPWGGHIGIRDTQDGTEEWRADCFVVGSVERNEVQSENFIWNPFCPQGFFGRSPSPAFPTLEFSPPESSRTVLPRKGLGELSLVRSHDELYN